MTSKKKPTANLEIIYKFKPKTEKQAELSEAIKSNNVVFITGPAGTGKTYVSVAMACEAFIGRKINRIVIVRPAVAACGEKLGFLPGDLVDKMDPFLQPIYDAMNDYWQDERIAEMIANKEIEIVPLGYMRGRTFNNSYVLTDEAQNCSDDQMLMLLTRIGNESKILIGGDLDQNDLGKINSGLSKGLKLAGLIDSIEHVEFTIKDCVRNPLIGTIIEAWKTI